MTSPYQIELLSSMKRLFTTGDFSDLTITCGDDFRKVHTAIVCGRSELLTKLYNDLEEDEGEKVISIPDDDPQAVDLMLHYLYTLDYPSVAATTSTTTTAANEDNDQVNGDHEAVRPSTVPDYSIEKEQFIEPSQASPVEPPGDQTATATTSSARSKKKKKKRAQSVVSAARSNSTTELNGAPLHNDHDDGSTASQAGGPSTNNLTTATAAGNNNSTDSDPSNLVVHARVYSLATKYLIAGLATLSASKFVTAVSSHWDTDDFLVAAREAYTSTGGEDRTLRDVVLSAIDGHPELLRREGVREVVKGLGQLASDLLFRKVDASVGQSLSGDVVEMEGGEEDATPVDGA